MFNRNWLSAHYLTVPAEQDITLDNGELLQVDSEGNEGKESQEKA